MPGSWTAGGTGRIGFLNRLCLNETELHGHVRLDQHVHCTVLCASAERGELHPRNFFNLAIALGSHEPEGYTESASSSFSLPPVLSQLRISLLYLCLLSLHLLALSVLSPTGKRQPLRRPRPDKPRLPVKHEI